MSGDVIVVIPARYASQRFPGKPLVPLKGKGGRQKPLIQRTWEVGNRIASASRVLVASDSEEILTTVEKFGGEGVFTSSQCRNGTERCAELLDTLAETEPDIIINLQGDAPLTPPSFVEALVKVMREDPSVQVATPAVRCSPQLYREIAADDAQGIVGGTFVAVSSEMQAHYFSKRMIPYFKLNALPDEHTPALLHIGLYAYRPSALRDYAASGPSQLEELEGLEQLRFLEMGVPVRVVEVPAPAWDIWELNNPTDVSKVEASLAKMGVE